MALSVKQTYAEGVDKIASAIVEMSHEIARENKLSLTELDDLMRSNINAAIVDINSKVFNIKG